MKLHEQVYLGFPGADDDARTPAKVLRSFHKTCEARAEVTYVATDAELSRWDVAAQRWALVITPVFALGAKHSVV